MRNLFKIIKYLSDAKIFFEIKKYRDDFIMICASVPGERWEIEISVEGQVEFEIFSSDGGMYDEDALEKRIAKFSE